MPEGPPQLDAEEQRVLGSLMEKQVTVPASYPLSAAGLKTACNQTSSRDPVVSYDDRQLLAIVARLKERQLLRTVWAGAGSRVLKYHQLLTEVLGLDAAETAVVTVLLLRGPQAPGELKTRTERLHDFADRAEVEAVLEHMRAGEQPLVVRLERRPGQQDHRWAHLLGPAPAGVAPAAEPIDLESVLSGGPTARDQRVVRAYDEVAASYADRLDDELDRKPFDTWLLDRIADLADTDPIVDAGCGPGHLAAYLASRGATVTAYDLSPGMVAEAQVRHPELDVHVGDLFDLLKPRAAAGWGAVVAWYALVHLAPSELPTAIAALTRVLATDGHLALALHVGGAVHHVDELMGHEVNLDFVLHDRDAVLAAVRAAGLVDIEWYQRGPLDEDVEVQTERLYVMARKR
ncbi:MAG TPA: DUF480 domain-containing protein [Propionibacteriaceae bacterium]|nr:DUF480 domain-containing protein [Propionibacteriaceae bacterium]